MTGFSWDTATSPRAMLSFLRGCRTLDERKLALFAAHCCRRVWHLLTDERSRAAVEVVERFVDGDVSGEALGLARQDAVTALRDTIQARHHDPSLPEMFTLAARMASFTAGAPGSDSPGVTDVVAFGRVGVMHDFSYLGGFIGILTGSAYLVIVRVRMSRQAPQ